MCNRPSTTLARALRSVKTMSAAERAELRRVLDEAPEPPSLEDAIRARRGAVAHSTTETRDARIRAAITPAPVGE